MSEREKRERHREEKEKPVVLGRLHKRAPGMYIFQAFERRGIYIFQAFEKCSNTFFISSSFLEVFKLFLYRFLCHIYLILFRFPLL